MNVQCTLAGPDDHQRLLALLQLYAYDFSEILPLEVAEDGRFQAPSVTANLTDPRNHAFLIRVDDKLAGFALVQPSSYLTGEAGVFDMAELFVMRRHRRRGVGEQVASWLFDRFAGPWEVREKAENQAAAAFWRRIIGRYTDGQFEEMLLDDERWRGPVQRFDSARHQRTGTVLTK
jgi:predicted acetyltransferase